MLFDCVPMVFIEHVYKHYVSYICYTLHTLNSMFGRLVSYSDQLSSKMESFNKNAEENDKRRNSNQRKQQQ